jgi:hypothetical protein
MGLDSMWVVPVVNAKNEDPDFDPELRLVGGAFSRHGKGSFRGKVYSDIIENITGVNLYHKTIPNPIIREMSEKLEAFELSKEFYKDNRIWEGQTYEEYSEQINDLKRMFAAYAEAGASLHG